MKLHSPAFEQALRREVKQAVKAEPELRRDLRRMQYVLPETVLGRWLQLILRPCVSFLLGYFVAISYQDTHEIETPLCAMSLWSTAMLLVSFQLLVIWQSHDITTLRFLPVPDTTIFQWELSKFFRGIGFVLGDLVIGLGTLGFLLHFPVSQWLVAILLVPLTLLHLLALAALVVSRFPKLPSYRKLIAALLYIVMMVGLLGGMFPHLKNSPVKPETEFAVVPFINLGLPTGWPLVFLQLGQPSTSWWLGLVILPIGAVLGSFPSSLRIIKARLAYKETPDAEVGLEPESAVDPGTASPGITAIEESLLSGELFVRKDWNTGWIENHLWRWFTDRERNLVEFFAPHIPRVTGYWRKVFLRWALVVVASLAVSWLNPVAGGIMFGLGLAYVFFMAGSSVIYTGNTFWGMPWGGVKMCLFATYPVTVRELALMLLKFSAIQMPLFMLLVIASVLALEPLTGLGLLTDIVVGINLSLLAWGGRYLALTYSFVFTTGVGDRFTLRSVGVVLTYLLFGFTFLALVVGECVTFGMRYGMVLGLPLGTTVLSMLALLEGYVFYRLYLWLHRVVGFDLMRSRGLG